MFRYSPYPDTENIHKIETPNNSRNVPRDLRRLYNNSMFVELSMADLQRVQHMQ